LVPGQQRQLSAHASLQYKYPALLHRGKAIVYYLFTFITSIPFSMRSMKFSLAAFHKILRNFIKWYYFIYYEMLRKFVNVSRYRRYTVLNQNMQVEKGWRCVGILFKNLRSYALFFAVSRQVWVLRFLSSAPYDLVYIEHFRNLDILAVLGTGKSFIHDANAAKPKHRYLIPRLS
jgi:hypothetical protein